jgi:YbbR domain-containing protein
VLTRVVHFFTENWALKLAALGIAIMLWLAVRADEPRLATFHNIPVRVDLRDPDWRLIGQPQPPVVSVTVRGSDAALFALAGDPPRIELGVDRVNDSIETHIVPLQRVELPAAQPGVAVEDLRPDTIRLRFERLARRTLPVRVSLENDLPEGLALALPINTNPASVQVRGPASELARLDSVPLFPVDLSGLRSTTNLPTAVDTTALGSLVVDPREVNVILRVVPADSQPGLRADSGRRAPF